jgi:hypothetical protein
MAANTSPIYSLTPNIGDTNILTTSTMTRSDGVGTIGTNLFLVFTAGLDGSFVQRVRFIPVSSAAAVNSVATTLRVFLSSLNVGTTTTSDTFLIAEISVPAISTANATSAATYYEIPLNIAVPTGHYILVSQHVAQTTNQNWQAMVFGGNY